MDRDNLVKKAEEYYDGQKASVLEQTIVRESTSLDQIRDALLDVGRILEEDLEEGCYVARVTTGRGGSHGPIIATSPCDEGVQVAGVVVRGAKKPVLEAFDLFRSALDGNPPKRKRRHMGLRLFFLSVLIIAFLVALSKYYLLPHIVMPAQAATVEYNEAVEAFNSIVPEYNAAAEGVAVDNLRGFVQEAQTLSPQGTDYLSVCKAIVGGNNADKITSDTSVVRDMASELENDVSVLCAIRNPSKEWVAEKLDDVDGIGKTEAVTAYNDPNGMLDKEGGYTSCTYFTTGLLDDAAVEGSNPVRKGVDGGGAVEVFSTLEDAQARCEYLSGFDGTLLYSGSYAIVGTMVIRTSCLLDDDAQYALTNDIVTSMITT